MSGFSHLCTNIRLADRGRLLQARANDQQVEIDLDTLLGNHIGRFVWGRQAYSGSARDTQLLFRYEYVDDKQDKDLPPPRRRTVLQARLLLPDQSWYEDRVDLDAHISLVDGELVPTKMPRSRTIVICLDGTGNEFDDTNTNVVHFMRALQKSDPSAQQVYYQDGLGTYTGTYSQPGFVTSVAKTVAKIADQAVAWNLDAHVMSAYKYLMNTYKFGDKVSIFGFSRGAHTARALAGMIHAVGVLPAHNEEHIPFAYSAYKRYDESKEGRAHCSKFKSTFSEQVDIHFLGVWDTVNSTGFLWPRSLPCTDQNPSVNYFRQALALDERRVKFLPSTNRPCSPSDLTGDVPKFKEVWFAGDHCNVGGGHDKDDEGKTLANIPLRWMIQEAIACGSDILFKASVIDRTAHYPGRICFRVDADGTIKGSVDRAAETLDERSTVYDLVTKWWVWRVLEWIPTYTHQAQADTDSDAREGTVEAPTTRVATLRWNRGRGREIDLHEPIYIHESVRKLLYFEADADSDEGYISSADPERDQLLKGGSGKKAEPYQCKARFGHENATLRDVIEDPELSKKIVWVAQDK